MLTPEEFAKLTAQGVLKFNPPPKQEINNRTAAKVPSPTVQTAAMPITPGPAPNKATAVQALSFKNAVPLQSSEIDVSIL